MEQDVAERDRWRWSASGRPICGHCRRLYVL